MLNSTQQSDAYQWSARSSIIVVIEKVLAQIETVAADKVMLVAFCQAYYTPFSPSGSTQSPTSLVMIIVPCL